MHIVTYITGIHINFCDTGKSTSHLCLSFSLREMFNNHTSIFLQPTSQKLFLYLKEIQNILTDSLCREKGHLYICHKKETRSTFNLVAVAVKLNIMTIPNNFLQFLQNVDK